MHKNNENALLTLFAKLEQEDYPSHSRVHPLKIGQEYGVGCYIKREDELGCLLSGSKVRKFRSLLKALKQQHCQKVGLIGSQFSNQVLYYLIAPFCFILIDFY